VFPNLNSGKVRKFQGFGNLCVFVSGGSLKSGNPHFSFSKTNPPSRPEKEVSVERGASAHRPQFVAAGILPAVSSGIFAARATKTNQRHNLVCTSDHPAGSRAIRQPKMAAATGAVPECTRLKASMQIQLDKMLFRSRLVLPTNDAPNFKPRTWKLM
jgi:hypothetical protein